MPLPIIPIVGSIFASISLPAIKYLLPFIIFSAIKFLGITLITFGASTFVLDGLTSLIMSNFSGLPESIAAIITMAGLPDAVSILIAGWAAQFQLKQLLGSFSKMKLTGTST